MKTILITGTTSGLGKAFLDHFTANGDKVININRRIDENFQKQYPKAEFHTIDISNDREVLELMNTLKQCNQTPDTFILNAGINRIDNVSGFNLETFKEVYNTNFWGVMNFIGAISKLGLKNKNILGISSTSNIVPNPGNLSYFLTKQSVHEAFKLLGQNDPGNKYQTVVLGPVHTNIMAGYPQPEGFQKKLFEILAVNPKETVAACVKFMRTNKKSLLYPFWVGIFYYCVKLATKVLPGIYKGSTQKQLVSSKSN